LRESTPLPDPDPGEEGGEYGQTAVQEHPAMVAVRIKVRKGVRPRQARLQII
jgi:hypothetical protein